MSASEATAQTDTVTIEIDGESVEVSKGSMIIEAADRIGVSIPRFCYHKKLSIAANCRMCLVDVEKAPKPMPACATPVADGMKVFTESARARDAQRNVMEFLLINHPLDCPICDQGGECELQDVAMGYGRSVSRFTERKRVVKDEDLGSLVETDMTRCIHCTRCVRFLEEIAGTSELGGMGRGEKTMISTYIGKSIDSEISGNIIDVCPVGALTNKPFKYQARAWEMRARDNVSSHDALGANLFFHTRRGKIMRAVPRDNEAINETWLADRDRYAHFGLYHEDRVTGPLIRQNGEWVATDWNTALAEAAELLKKAGKDLATLVSPRASAEEIYLAERLTRGLGSDRIDHRLRAVDFTDGHRDGVTQMALADLEDAEVIVVVDSNVRMEMPLLAHRIRKAVRNSAKVVVINPVDYEFRFDAEQTLVQSPSQTRELLAAIAAQLGVDDARLNDWTKAAKHDAAKSIAKLLTDAKNAAVVFGHAGSRSPQASAHRALARAIASKADVAFNEIPQAANSVAAAILKALPEDGSVNTQTLLAEKQAGYLLVQCEPEMDSSVGSNAIPALQNTPTIVVSAFASDSVREYADVILPAGEWGEIDGTLVNLDGMVQQCMAAAKPLGLARDGWKILRMLGDKLGVAEVAVDDLGSLREKLQDALEASADAPHGDVTDSDADWIQEVGIYAGDQLTRRSEPLQQTVHGGFGSIRVNAEDAAEQNLSQDDVQADERISRGTTIVRIGADAAPDLTQDIAALLNGGAS